MNDLIDKDYLTDLNKIKETIKQNQNKAMVIVNSAMIMTYYEIGTIINKRKKWGSKYIQKLSEDLKEYGKGFGYDNLNYMAKFANEFYKEEIFDQPGRLIPWRSIVIIMQKAKSHEEMLWYINQTYKNSWSRSTVLKQFEAKAYERGIIEPSTTPSIKNDDSTKELFKDSYVFSFLKKENTYNESNLKKALLDNVIDFLHELGPGFTLVDKEYKLVTPTNKIFFIDLLMYHTKIHSYIVIELKIGDFEPADLGQLSFYVNAINKLERTEIEGETIGVLLCKNADKFVAETTLETSKMKLWNYEVYNGSTILLSNSNSSIHCSISNSFCNTNELKN